MNAVSKTIKNLITKTVEIILHPLLMTFYMALLLHFNCRLLFFVALFSILIPALVFVALRRYSIIRNYNFAEKGETVTPYAGISFSYIALLYFLYSISAPLHLLLLFAIPVFILFLLAIVSSFYRISASMAGIGGLTGAMLAFTFLVKHENDFVMFIFLFIFAGCLGVVRLLKEQNTPAQIYSGYAVGFITAIAIQAVGAWLYTN
jgi:hypothetical protein